MINIPHKKPIRFVKEVLSLDENSAMVSVSFFNPPTLAMICEAAAQSSGAFAKERRIGYLLSLKECLKLQEPTSLEYIIKTTKTLEFDDMHEFDFEMLFNNNPIAKGSFIVKTRL